MRQQPAHDLTRCRWIIIGVLSLLALLLCPFTQKNVGMVSYSFRRLAIHELTRLNDHHAVQAIATSMTGSFLLFLGIDLLANQTNGMSLGLVR